MTAEEIQVLELAGQGGSVEEIANELHLEQATVKFCLTKHGMLKEDEISDDDFNDIREGLIQLAKYSKNEFVRSRVGMFLYERKKGALKDLRGALQVNIGNLNLLIAASHQKIIDALSTHRGNGNGATRVIEALSGQSQDQLSETGGNKAIAAGN